MLPQAETKMSKYIEILNGMAPPNEVNRFMLKQIIKEANQLKADNPADAFALLGMVACVEQDADGVHRNHKNALNYENSLRQKKFYGSSLSALGLFEEAYQYLTEAHAALDEIGTNELNHMIRCTFYLDMDDKFDEYTKYWELKTGKRHPLTIFPEDSERDLAFFLGAMDTCIKNDPAMIEDINADMFDLAEELVKGVSV